MSWKREKFNYNTQNKHMKTLSNRTKWSPKYENGIEMAWGFNDIAEKHLFRFVSLSVCYVFPFVCRSACLISSLCLCHMRCGILAPAKSMHKNYSIQWINGMHANKNSHTPELNAKRRSSPTPYSVWRFSVGMSHAIDYSTVAQFRHIIQPTTTVYPTTVFTMVFVGARTVFIKMFIKQVTSVSNSIKLITFRPSFDNSPLLFYLV